MLKTFAMSVSKPRGRNSASGCSGGWCGCGCGKLGTYEAALRNYLFEFPALPKVEPAPTPLGTDGLLGLSVSGVPIFLDHPEMVFWRPN